MIRRSLLALALFASAAGLAQAQISSFTEGFDDITTLPGSGWNQQNLSTPAGTNPVWFQGNDTVFVSQAGASNAYIAANFNSVAGANTISNWLLTPHVTLSGASTFTFFTRKVSPDSFPDRLQVRLSTNGASTNVGATNASVGDFTTLLLDINPTLVTGVYPTDWTQFTVNIADQGAGASGRIAFRYFVTNGGPSGANSDYIGIDTVSFAVSAVPEPTTWALLGLGACGVFPAYKRWRKGKKAETNAVKLFAKK